MLTSPTDKSAGFLESPPRFPASPSRARTRQSELGTYRCSTGRHRRSFGQNITRGVYVSVVPHATYRTGPLPHRQRQGLKPMSTPTASLRAGKKATDHLQGATIPGRFVRQLAYKLSPTRVGNGPRQGPILPHVLDGQILHADHLVFVDQTGGQLVQEVAPPVGDAGWIRATFWRALLRLLERGCLRESARWARVRVWRSH